MISLVMVVLCSTLIALILKHNDSKSGSAIVLLFANYVVATSFSTFFFVTDKSASYSAETLGLGAILGLMFLLSFFAFAKAVEFAGAALAQVSSRISVVIPIGLSIIVFFEFPGLWGYIGILLAFLTIFLFYRSFGNGSNQKVDKKAYLWLIGLFTGIGVNDFAFKLFEQWRPPSEKEFFLTCIFGFALIFSALYVFISKTRIDSGSIKRGLMLGVPNIFSSFFLINALRELPAYIVFPIANISIIIFTSLGAFIIWKEKQNTFGRLAIITGIVAILLLSMN